MLSKAIAIAMIAKAIAGIDKCKEILQMTIEWSKAKHSLGINIIEFISYIIIIIKFFKNILKKILILDFGL